MRGTPRTKTDIFRTRGIIPAYAGNTCLLRRRPRHQRDHPRVCGEHRIVRVRVTAVSGSSPRMRGTRRMETSAITRTGIIPAYAGNTWIFHICKTQQRDHPRVCGEHCPLPGNARERAGSSPRMRGTQGGVVVGGGAHGIIPAYAGNTPCIPVFCGMNGDHPRVCGEHRNPASVVAVGTGSSPRMRGTHVYKTVGGVLCGIIPAYAGNTPLIMIKWWTCLGSSPRMRGTPGRARTAQLDDGIIPAYAGNTGFEPWTSGL